MKSWIVLFWLNIQSLLQTLFFFFSKARLFICFWWALFLSPICLSQSLWNPNHISNLVSNPPIAHSILSNYKTHNYPNSSPHTKTSFPLQELKRQFYLILQMTECLRFRWINCRILLEIYYLLSDLQKNHLLFHIIYNLRWNIERNFNQTLLQQLICY